MGPVVVRGVEKEEGEEEEVAMTRKILRIAACIIAPVGVAVNVYNIATAGFSSLRLWYFVFLFSIGLYGFFGIDSSPNVRWKRGKKSGGPDEQ